MSPRPGGERPDRPRRGGGRGPSDPGRERRSGEPGRPAGGRGRDAGERDPDRASRPWTRGPKGSSGPRPPGPRPPGPARGAGTTDRRQSDESGGFGFRAPEPRPDRGGDRQGRPWDRPSRPGAPPGRGGPADRGRVDRRGPEDVTPRRPRGEGPRERAHGEGPRERAHGAAPWSPRPDRAHRTFGATPRPPWSARDGQPRPGFEELPEAPRPGGRRPWSPDVRRGGAPDRQRSPGPIGREAPSERPGRWPERRPERLPRIPDAARLELDEELVAGRRPVEEAFAARRPAIRLLVVPQRRQALEKIVLHATTLRIPIVEVEGGTLTGLAGFDGHQGVALVVEPRTYATLDQVLARAIERAEPPFVLVLDSLEDPQNVGTLLRSAEAAGVHGVLFPTERQAPISPAAVKASAGATEHLLLCPVDDLPGCLADLHIRGLRIVGSDADAPLTTRETDLRGPVAIVVGSEGQGVGPVVRRRCDVFVRIPMRGAIGSLNAAVAGSILLFEALGQRDPDARPARPEGSGRRGREREEPVSLANDDDATSEREPRLEAGREGGPDAPPAAPAPHVPEDPAALAAPRPFEDDAAALLPGGPTPVRVATDDSGAEGERPAVADDGADAGTAPAPVAEPPKRRRRTPRA